MKTIISLIVACIVVSSGAYPQGTAEKTQLEDFAAFAEDEQLQVNEWTVTMKEALKQSDIEEVISDVSQLFQESFTTEDTIHAKKMTWKRSNEEQTLVETFTLIAPIDGKINSEMVYSFRGEGTASLDESLKKRKDIIKSRLFSKNVTIFSCLKAHSSDIIDDVLVYQNFKKVFNIVTIDEVTENGWTSRSGYSNQWGQSLPILNEEMNVQFASRTLGGRTNITIGTPIITAEY